MTTSGPPGGPITLRVVGASVDRYDDSKSGGESFYDADSDTYELFLFLLVGS